MARLAPFETNPHLAVGVSGGPDSLALALLAHHWAVRRGGRITALIVDHGLRSGSANDAAQAEAWLIANGIASVRLTWTGLKPLSGIQAAAREARHGLMAAWCRESGVLHLLLGHHAEDHTETVHMRQTRGSGEDGLAGIPAIAWQRGYRVLRPLLGWPKARLQALLRTVGQSWLEDPANHDDRFLRARLRAMPLERPSPEPEQARRDRDVRVARWLARYVSLDPFGCARVDLRGWDEAEAEAGMRRVLASVGGSPYPAAVTACAALMRRIAGSRTIQGTLGGCVVHRRGALVRVHREPAAVSDRIMATDARSCLWDSRFICRATDSAGLELRALGHAPLPEAVRWHGRRIVRLDPVVRACLPGLWAIDRIVAVPHLGGNHTVLTAGVPVLHAAFAPRYRLTEAAFVGKTILG